MERKPVMSSNIKSVGYDEIHKLLEIEFASGEVCTFSNISGEEYGSLLNSSCMGKYFYKFIKNRQGYYLNHIEFHEDLLKLMKSHPAFSKISIEPDFKMNERRISPDIVCQYGAKTLIIEIKMRVPAVISEIKTTINEMERFAGVVKDAQLVLAIPGMLQKSYVEIFNEKGIEIWDLEVIANIFHDQLNLIKGNLLYSLLSSETDIKDSLTSDKLIQSLKKIKIGKEEWSQYQKLLVHHNISFATLYSACSALTLHRFL
ncbi:MAG: KTSC domain-containing protein [Methanothrix sp.]